MPCSRLATGLRLPALAAALFLVPASALAVDPGDEVVVTEALTSRRFAGENTAGPEVAAGTQATVLAVVGEEVRLSLGAGRAGWVPVASVAAEVVPAELPEP